MKLPPDKLEQQALKVTEQLQQHADNVLNAAREALRRRASESGVTVIRSGDDLIKRT